MSQADAPERVRIAREQHPSPIGGTLEMVGAGQLPFIRILYTPWTVLQQEVPNAFPPPIFR